MKITQISANYLHLNSSNNDLDLTGPLTNPKLSLYVNYLQSKFQQNAPHLNTKLNRMFQFWEQWPWPWQNWPNIKSYPKLPVGLHECFLYLKFQHFLTGNHFFILRKSDLDLNPTGPKSSLKLGSCTLAIFKVSARLVYPNWNYWKIGNPLFDAARPLNPYLNKNPLSLNFLVIEINTQNRTCKIEKYTTEINSQHRT